MIIVYFQEGASDGELRRSSYRKRSMSSASRRSLVSITSAARPLTTSPPHSPTPSTTRVRLTSSPALPMVSEAKRLAYQTRKYYTVHHAQPAIRAYAPNMKPTLSMEYDTSIHMVSSSLSPSSLITRYPSTSSRPDGSMVGYLDFPCFVLPLFVMFFLLNCFM